MMNGGSTVLLVVATDTLFYSSLLEREGERDCTRETNCDDQFVRDSFCQLRFFANLQVGLPQRVIGIHSYLLYL